MLIRLHSTQMLEMEDSSFSFFFYDLLNDGIAGRKVK